MDSKSNRFKKDDSLVLKIKNYLLSKLVSSVHRYTNIHVVRNCINLTFVCVQVRVLELEKDLTKERFKLGKLRKQHYKLAGESEGWEVGEVSLSYSSK